MVQSAEWQQILKERGWVDMHQSSDQFASFLKGEQGRIEGILKELGLVQ
jgi:putative tricarboxylic transport membrane protein